MENQTFALLTHVMNGTVTMQTAVELFTNEQDANKCAKAVLLLNKAKGNEVLTEVKSAKYVTPDDMASLFAKCKEKGIDLEDNQDSFFIDPFFG